MSACLLYNSHSSLRVGVGALLLAERLYDGHEAAPVLDASLGAARLLLALLLRLHLGRLTLDLTGTGQRAVHLTCGRRRGTRLSRGTQHSQLGPRTEDIVCRDMDVTQWREIQGPN